MSSRRLAALTVALVLIIGCAKTRTRAQGPFNRQPVPPNPTLVQGTQPVTRAPAAVTAAADPLPPAPPAVTQPAPARPPEPAPVAGTPQSPQAPRQPPIGPTLTTPGADSSGLGALKKLAQAAAAKWAAIDTYEARMVRRETLKGVTGPTEEVLFQFRKQPMSVYMKNLGAAGKGREVLYNPTQHGDKIHLIIGEGDPGGFMFKPGSKGPSLSPDAPMVTSRSRHSIREAGFGTPVNNFAALVAKVEAGKIPASAVKYGGIVKREEYGDYPLEGVEQTIRPNDDEALPGGGVRHWFFDARPESPSFGLPLLTILYDANRRELEYYRISQVRTPANLTDADFDPARLSKK